MTERSYVIGLPVVITVYPDGRVIAAVDLSEADDLHDDSTSWGSDTYTTGEVDADILAIRLAIDTNTIEVTG